MNTSPFNNLIKNLSSNLQKYYKEIGIKQFEPSKLTSFVLQTTPYLAGMISSYLVSIKYFRNPVKAENLNLKNTVEKIEHALLKFSGPISVGSITTLATRELINLCNPEEKNQEAIKKLQQDLRSELVTKDFASELSQSIGKIFLYRDVLFLELEALNHNKLSKVKELQQIAEKSSEMAFLIKNFHNKPLKADIDNKTALLCAIEAFTNLELERTINEWIEQAIRKQASPKSPEIFKKFIQIFKKQTIRDQFVLSIKKNLLEGCIHHINNLSQEKTKLGSPWAISSKVGLYVALAATAFLTISPALGTLNCVIFSISILAKTPLISALVIGISTAGLNYIALNILNSLDSFKAFFLKRSQLNRWSLNFLKTGLKRTVQTIEKQIKKPLSLDEINRILKLATENPSYLLGDSKAWCGLYEAIYYKDEQESNEKKKLFNQIEKIIINSQNQTRDLQVLLLNAIAPNCDEGSINTLITLLKTTNSLEHGTCFKENYSHTLMLREQFLKILAVIPSGEFALIRQNLRTELQTFYKDSLNGELQDLAIVNKLQLINPNMTPLSQIAKKISEKLKTIKNQNDNPFILAGQNESDFLDIGVTLPQEMGRIKEDFSDPKKTESYLINSYLL